MRRIIWSAIFGLLLALSLPGGPVAAQSAERERLQEPQPTPSRSVSDDEVNAIARDLYCPICEGIPLDACTTQACADWREIIRGQLAEGWNKEMIQEYFRSRYGDRVLAVPPNPLVFIIPAVLIALAAVLFGLALWRTRKPMEMPAPPADETSDDPYAARLEEELKKRLQGK